MKNMLTILFLNTHTSMHTYTHTHTHNAVRKGNSMNSVHVYDEHSCTGVVVIIQSQGSPAGAN